MSFVANPFVAVLDANVLYPVSVRDVLLTFTQDGLFRARFTDVILDEWTRSLIAKKPSHESSVQRQAALISEHFSECFVEGYQSLIDGLSLPDEDDRHVLAAAIRCSAQVIVTENLRDFPADRLEEHAVEAVTADDFLVGTYDLFPTKAAFALRRMRKKRKNPPFTVSEFLLDLTRSGLPKLAATARQNVEAL